MVCNIREPVQDTLNYENAFKTVYSYCIPLTAKYFTVEQTFPI